MPNLTKDEYEALISLPEFQKALWTIRHRNLEEEKAKKASSGLCEGADPIREKTGFKCPKCGLFLEYTDNSNENRNHEILLSKRHWNRPDRPDANPFTKSGLFGKAAAAAEGDWYGSH